MIRRRLLALLQVAPALWLAGRAGLTWGQPRGVPRRVALVIGNAQYPQATLNNPENDAKLIARTLRSLGFEVGEHLNLRGRDFKRVLRDFARRMDDDDTASVFFYAGHGMQIDRRNYLLPIDLNLRDEDEVRDEAVDIEEALLSRIDRVRDRARIFIIDACRDNPFAPRTRAVRGAGGLAEMAAPGALIAFSAAPGRVAEDGPAGGNSVYSRVLAAEMRAEGVEVEEMLKNVRVKVLRETKERQIPWVNTSMVVNFMFNPGAAGIAKQQAAAAAAAAGARASMVTRSVRVLIRAERNLNTDSREKPASLALRIYLLRDAQGFERANFDALYDNDDAALGQALLARENLYLRPGESREVTLEVARDARVIAVFAAYRELERSQWRAVLALPAEAPVPAARIDAQARQVQLGWAR